MAVSFSGQLEVDARRGVVYFHTEDLKIPTLLRVCRLSPEQIPKHSGLGTLLILPTEGKILFVEKASNMACWKLEGLPAPIPISDETFLDITSGVGCSWSHSLESEGN